MRNLSSVTGNGRFQLFPDPVYKPFPEDGIKYYKSDYLTINVSSAAACGAPVGVWLYFCSSSVVWAVTDISSFDAYCWLVYVNDMFFYFICRQSQ